MKLAYLLTFCLFTILLISTQGYSYEIFFFHNDQLGSTRVITDQDGKVVWSADYLPFGGTFNENGNHAEFKYNSKEFDNTGFYYYGARYYDPNIGRFLTPDAIDNFPNPYIYVRNNPLRFIDSNGNFPSPSEIVQRAKNSYTVNINEYKSAKEAAKALFGGVKPMAVFGDLTEEFAEAVMLSSELSGMDPELIFTAYEQEGGLYLHEGTVFDPERIIDTFCDVGMDSLYSEVNILSKMGIKIKPIYTSNYDIRNEDSMRVKVMRIKEKDAVLAMGGMLKLRYNSLKRDVIRKWGKSSWEKMPDEAKWFWTYVYYNAGPGYKNNNGNLAGRGLLYRFGIDWYRQYAGSYYEVHFNAARTAGAAHMLRKFNVFK